MNTPETIEEITQRAIAYAENANTSLHSGYLLLAILTGSGVAANTLSLRGLTETNIRTKLREDSTETEEHLKKVSAGALQFAQSVRSNSVGAIHLLAAIATVRESRGNQILQECNLNVDTIRVQSLRNMTSGLTREHGFRPAKKQLKLSSMQDSPTPKNSRISPRNESSSPVVTKKRVLISQTKDMGRQLEQAQKKMRQVRKPTAETKNEGSLSQEEKQSFIFSAKEYPTLFSLGRNLIQEAAQGALQPIVGRVLEIEQIADILNKKRANCPCLVGAPGVGKTAIVEGLACDMLFESIEGIHFEAIVEVSIGALLGGTTLRGELSEKIIEISKEIQASDGKIVLFFDDVHTFLGSPDAQEAVTELKSAMSRGEIPSIWATTDTEYNKNIDAASARLITTIDIAEPTEDEALEILAGVAPEYETHHGVKIGVGALRASVLLSSRYISESCLPDKAVSIIDLAASQVKRRGKNTVEEDDIAAVLASKLGVPLERLATNDAKRLLQLESELAKDIIGHHHALTALAETLRRNAAGFRTGRPIGSFLFLGPTGVGKTETAKSLAKLLFADERAMIRLDMSEFSEAHAVAKLVGAPPGYIGHEDGGQLTDAVRKRPYSLVLLDEVEKGHRDVIQSLLQVLDDGRLTDGKGKTVDFKNTVIIMTSNLGSDLRKQKEKKSPVGFGSIQSNPCDNLESSIISAARIALPPELWNRIDEPMVFHPLTQAEVAQIAKLMLHKLTGQIQKEKEISLVVSHDVIDYLVEQGGYDVQLGARPMRRTISRLIEGPIARIILGQSQRGDSIHVSVLDGELTFQNIPLCPQQAMV